MIPKMIQPYFKMMQQTSDRDNSLIEGILTCCNAHDFEVLVVGKVKHSVFAKMFLYPDNDKTVIEVRCKKCGKVISVFNNSSDGYGQCGNRQTIYVITKPIKCVKCRNESFSVIIKYEYPDTQELKELEISEMENAFTWIWVTLECNNCGTRYKNFIDCETT